MKHHVLICCLLIVISCNVPFVTATTLEKLRRPDAQQSWREARYDLVVMGHDAAVNFLIQTLEDKSRDARFHAISFLELEFRDPRALPALTEVFLHDTEIYIRRRAAWALASIDLKYAADLMVQHLNADKETQDIAIKLLSELKDARVIPTLVTRVNNFVEEKEGFFRVAENGSLMSEKHAFLYMNEAAFTLADFKHIRAVPVLFRMLTAKEVDIVHKVRAAEYLAQIGETQAIPDILELFDSWVNVSKALQQFGPAVVPPLLERLKQTNDATGANDHRIRDIRERIVSILEEIRDPELAPIYGQLYLEALHTEDWRLREAMIKTLPNMGEAGMRTLITITQAPHFNGSVGLQEVLNALSTYNSTEAVEAVGALALDESFSNRLRAITTLGWFGQFWDIDVSEYFKPLLAANDPTVKIETMSLMIYKVGLFQAKAAELSDPLNQLLTDNDPAVKLKALELMYLLGLFEFKDMALSKHLNQLLAGTDATVKLNTLSFMLRNDLFEAKDAALPKHLKQLLTDNDPTIRLRVIQLFQITKPIELKPVLSELIETSDEFIQDAAYTAWHALSEKSPLRLNIEINQERYAYGEPIELRYTLVNTSIYPVKVLNLPSTGTEARTPEDLISRNIEIQQPDGTLGGYVGKLPEKITEPQQPPQFHQLGRSVIIREWVPKPEDYKTLQPGDKLTGTIPVHGLYQSGKHTLKCPVLGWTLVKTELHFHIEPPKAAQLNAMLARIDIERIVETDLDKVAKACQQLGELRIPKAIPALKNLVLYNPEYTSNSDQENYAKSFAIHEVKRAAIEALEKFSDPDLTPMWIEFLESGWWIRTAIKKVEMSGDTRAVKPLQRIAFGNMDKEIRIAAAFALKKLGDSSGVEWFRRIAQRQLQSRYPTERSDGVSMLTKLYPQYNNAKPSWYLSTTYRSWFVPRSFPWPLWNLVDNRDPDIVENWEQINKKAENISGLKKLLAHTNPDVQRAAAYELAYFGDASGVHLIQQDLTAANDAETRMGARGALFQIQTDQTE